MSEEGKGSPLAPAADLQQAFDEAAAGLDLRLEPAGGGTPRCIGIAFMIYASIPYPIDTTPPPIDRHDDQEIKRLIRGHESLTEAQYRDGTWRNHLFDTHMVVARQGLIETNQAVIVHWLDSPQFVQFQQDYPWKDPRDVKVRNIRIAYLGTQLASATYRVVEKLANGKVIGGNAATLFARLDQVGWRGVVITKGERQEV